MRRAGGSLASRMAALQCRRLSLDAAHDGFLPGRIAWLVWASAEPVTFRHPKTSSGSRSARQERQAI